MEELSLADDSKSIGCVKDPYDHVKKEGSQDLVDVLVRTLDKKEFKCRVSKDIFVNDLKLAVARATGVQSQCQRLLSSGKEMSDECRLSDYNQSLKQVVYLVVRFPGATFGASLSEKEDELPSTIGEESALRSYAFRGTVTIPVPERSIERVMASLLQRGVVNGGQLQQLAALSANSWRSMIGQQEPRRTTRSEFSSAHPRRTRRRDHRGAEREREREGLRRRDHGFSRYRSPQNLDHGVHDNLLEPDLYDDTREADYLLPPDATNLDDSTDLLSFQEGYDPVSVSADLEGLVLQEPVEVEESEYFEQAPTHSPFPPAQHADWEPAPVDSSFALPEGRLTGKRKHSHLSSCDPSQDPICSTVRRHRCEAAEATHASVELDVEARGVEVALAPATVGIGDALAVAEASSEEERLTARSEAAPIVMSQAGPRQVLTLPGNEASPPQSCGGADLPSPTEESGGNARDAPPSQYLECTSTAAFSGRVAADEVAEGKGLDDVEPVAEGLRDLAVEDKLLLSRETLAGPSVAAVQHEAEARSGSGELVLPASAVTSLNRSPSTSSQSSRASGAFSLRVAHLSSPSHAAGAVAAKVFPDMDAAPPLGISPKPSSPGASMAAERNGAAPAEAAVRDGEQGRHVDVGLPEQGPQVNDAAAAASEALYDKQPRVGGGRSPSAVAAVGTGPGADAGLRSKAMVAAERADLEPPARRKLCGCAVM